MKFLRKILFTALLLVAIPICSRAQFREEAFTQNYNSPNDTTAVRDSVDKLFSLKEYIGGLRHKNTLQVGTLFGGSTVFIGGEQIYNRQYWKLPIVYGGLGATVGLGMHFNSKYQKSRDAFEAAYELDPETTLTIDNDAKRKRNLMLAGAGLVYMATLMDGVINYETNRKPHPGKSTIYSILLPGLGQAYNGEFWKIPIYWGGIIGSYHFYSVNSTNYKRFRRIYNEAESTEVEYTGPIDSETALYYRNVYRRYRDYSVLAMAAFYLLQVIDANVFAYMQDFEVSDDVTMKLSPAIITPGNEYALASPGIQSSAVGLKLGIRF